MLKNLRYVDWNVQYDKLTWRISLLRIKAALGVAFSCPSQRYTTYRSIRGVRNSVTSETLQ
jgi:hypothetical protein